MWSPFSREQADMQREEANTELVVLTNPHAPMLGSSQPNGSPGQWRALSHSHQLVAPLGTHTQPDSHLGSSANLSKTMPQHHGQKQL